MSELDRLKRLLAILEKCINELSGIVAEIKLDKKPEHEAFKVKISDKAKKMN